MGYWTRSTVGLALIGASVTTFVYSLVDIISHVHGSCGSGVDNGYVLPPCPHNTGFWILALVLSVFVFIGGVVIYALKGSPPVPRPAQVSPIAAAPAAPAAPITGRLDQLEQLKASGLLDEEQFKQEKAKLSGGPA